jgi:hypothetical protein
VVDASSIFDFTGEKNPNVFNILSLLLVIFLIADIGFTSFRLGMLGALVTSFLFLVTLISAFGFTDNLLFTEGHPLSGNFAFTLGFLALNIGSIISGIEANLLSFATQSYLSGILGSEAGIITPMINLVFAPIGETFLIFLGFTAGIYSIVKRTSLNEASMLTKFLIVSVPPSLFFSVLHGGRGGGFFLLSFTINMIWTAILFYGELGSFKNELIPISTGLIVGLHMGFNTLGFGGIGKFFSTFIEGLNGPFNRSAALILLFMGLNFVFALLYLWEKRKVVF